MNITEAIAHFDPKIGLIVFVVYMAVDALYAYYTIQVTKKHAYSAATTGAVLYFLLAIGVLNYIQDYLYLIPLALGSWIGTFFAVRHG